MATQSFTVCSEDKDDNAYETTLFVAQGSLVITQVTLPPTDDRNGKLETNRVVINVDEGGENIPDMLRRLADTLELEEEA